MLKTEDLKTAYLKSEDSKYAFMCWEPHISMIKCCCKYFSYELNDTVSISLYINANSPKALSQGRIESLCQPQTWTEICYKMRRRSWLFPNGVLFSRL